MELSDSENDEKRIGFKLIFIFLFLGGKCVLAFMNILIFRHSQLSTDGILWED